MSCEVWEIVERIELVSEISSLTWGIFSKLLGVDIASFGGLFRECGVVLILICDNNTSGDGEMKVGLGRRDRDSSFKLLLPFKAGESDKTDRLVDIL